MLRRRSTSGSVVALVGVAAVSTLLGSPRKKPPAPRSDGWVSGRDYPGGWRADYSGEVYMRV